MLRLIEADFAASWKLHARDRTPSFFVNGGAGDAFLCERGHFCFQVVAQEIEFVRAVLIGGMEGGFARRQCEDQPAVAGIDGLESQNVAKKVAVRFRILRINDDVSTRDHTLLRGKTWNSWQVASLVERLEFNQSQTL